MQLKLQRRLDGNAIVGGDAAVEPKPLDAHRERAAGRRCIDGLRHIQATSSRFCSNSAPMIPFSKLRMPSKGTPMSKTTDLKARQAAAVPTGVGCKGIYVAKGKNSEAWV